jgi:hypothetical protein
MVAHVRSGFGEFFDDKRVWWVAGISHTQVDHILPGPAFLVEQIIDSAKQIRW